MDDPRSCPPVTGDISPESAADAAVEELRDILLSRYRRRIAELEREVEQLERQLSDEEALAATVSPIISDAIRRRIRDAREEMIEVLYPIIGQTVVRAVSEAMRDLARSVDARMRTTLHPRLMWRRLRGRLSGVSGAELALRDSLPFEVSEVFLIHRETGLLLVHVSREADLKPDSDLISSMLTAIRDFARDAFGRGEEGQLDEIQYGGRRILIEAGRYVYVAVVVDGVEPSGFRAELRERIIEIEHAFEDTLRNYDGDSAPLASAEEPLRSLITSVESRELDRGQKRLLLGILGVVVLCLLAVCLMGRWVFQATRATPTPLPIAVEATPTSTLTPSPTATTPTPTVTATSSPTPPATPTPTPTATATAAPTATPAPVLGAMTGSQWAHEGPSLESPQTGVIVSQGQPVEILAVFGDWCLVRWTPLGENEMTGWVLTRWVGTTRPVPPRIVTPAAGP